MGLSAWNAFMIPCGPAGASRNRAAPCNAWEAERNSTSVDGAFFVLRSASFLESSSFAASGSILLADCEKRVGSSLSWISPKAVSSSARSFHKASIGFGFRRALLSASTSNKTARQINRYCLAACLHRPLVAIRMVPWKQWRLEFFFLMM